MDLLHGHDVYFLYIQVVKAESKALENNVSFRDNPTFLVLDVNDKKTPSKKSYGVDQVDNKPPSQNRKPPTKGNEKYNSQVLLNIKWYKRS